MGKQKVPLIVYVLYDRTSDEPQQLYEYIYKLICREPNRPLVDGLDIPVYLRNKNEDGTISDIDFENAEHNIIISLVDIYMYSDSEWERFVRGITDSNLIERTNVSLLPIALTDYATDFAGLNKINIIKYNDNNIFKHKTDFEIRLYDYILSILKQKGEDGLQIFISHAKRDGKEKADELKQFIAMNTKLRYFYDANSIKDGVDFEKTIKKNAKNSLLVVLYSDAYSERDWCQREITIAKEALCPIVLVDMIENGTERAFPYLGNVPWVSYNKDNWGDVLNLLLRTALNHMYQKMLLDYIKATRGYSNCKVLPFAPELFTVTAINENTILYPEPPVGFSERELLRNRFKNKKFYTPSNLDKSLYSKLTGKRIAISVSYSDNLVKNGISKLMLQDFVIELARYIIVNDCTLIYGGDLRKNGFTESFAELSKNYKNYRNIDDTKNFFINYFAWPEYLKIKEDIEAIANFKSSRVETVFVDGPEGIDQKKIIKPDCNENRFIYAKSLSKMRELKEKSTDALIIIGGSTKDYKGFMPGILEEYIIAVKEKHPIYVLGGYGGMAEIIIDILDGKINTEKFKEILLSDKEFFDFCIKKNIISYTLDELYCFIKLSKEYVNKGLSAEENMTLRRSCNIIETIGLVFKGLQETL